MFESFLKPPVSFPTLTGSIVTFNSQYAGLPLKSHTVALTATQSGSGTPSPSNPRPITGYSAINISHSDADTSNPTVYTITIGSTVYGGEYDARSGVLTVTHKGIKLVDAPKNAWQVGTKSVCYRVSLTDISTTVSSGSTHGAISNMVDEYPAYFGALRPNEVDFNGFAISTGGVNLALYDTDLTLTEADFLTKYADIMFVYPLATPQTIQLPPCPIDTLEGVNNIWADTGDTTLSYITIG